MTFRTIGNFASALTLLIAATAYSPQAQASPVPILLEYDLTITFTPPDRTIPGNPIIPVFPDLTGAAAFTVPGVSLGDITPPQILKEFNIALIPGNPIFTGRFIPGNPISPVSFSFSGHSGDFAAFAFQTGNVPSSPPAVPFIPLGIFIPGNPIFIATGPIVAFDDAVQIGTWNVTISETPLPAALPLFATGLGGLGLLGWRRKRKAALAA